MQTILGAGSAVSSQLAKSLSGYSNIIKLAGRNPHAAVGNELILKGDLSDPLFLDEAVKGSEIVYVTIGFEYKSKVWEEKWPPFMKSLIDSCGRHNVRIVFLDNMYMYDHKYLSDMKEDTPVNSGSRKGKVRARAAYMLMDAVERGAVNAVIARAADFYGPGVKSSGLMQTVYKNLLNNKNPLWVGNPDKIHNFSFSGDIANGMALLGNAPDTHNDIWHLPAFQDKITVRKLIEIFMEEMNVKRKINSIGKNGLSLLGVFVPILKEIKDVYYQLEGDYFFNSTKFNNRFNYSPAAPAEAVKKIVNS